jgi:hypothetical protein
MIVGANVTYTMFQFFATALRILPTTKYQWLVSITAFIYIALFLFSLYSMLQKKKTVHAVWLSAIFVFFGLFLYFLFFVSNPWVPNTKGQTWSLFKLTKYVYPTAIVGVGYALSKLQWQKIPIMLVVCLSLLVGIITHPLY